MLTTPTSFERNRNLMARDEFKNLGFAEQQKSDQQQPTQQTPPKPPQEPEKGAKGELRW